MIHITRRIYDQLVEWTIEEKPNEASGYLFKDNTMFCRIITQDKSRTHFMDDKLENLLGFIEENGKPSAIFHSHPGEAIPSLEDFKYMTTSIPFFDCIWLIMSNRMRLRAWTLKDNPTQGILDWVTFNGKNVSEIEVIIV